MPENILQCAIHGIPQITENCNLLGKKSISCFFLFGDNNLKKNKHHEELSLPVIKSLC